MSNSNQICLFSQPDDSNSFGFSVAINDKYLAVGDPGANRVVIYNKDSQGQWQRNCEIYPPENSIPHKVGRGFGRNFELDGNTLMVHSATRKNPKRHLVQPKDMQAFFSGDLDDYDEYKVYFQKYVFDLEQKNKVTRIDFVREKRKEFTNFYILHNRKPRQITLPNNGEKGFGASIAVHNNLILVGSIASQMELSPKESKGWIFDLNRLDNKPILLTAEKAYIGDTVAISEQFAVIGNSGTEMLIGEGLYPKTLITSLKNGSSSVIDNCGYVSIYKNILAIMRPYVPMGQFPLLQLFHLDKNSIPHLITEPSFLDNSKKEKAGFLQNTLLQNGWLLIVKNFFEKNYVKLCLKSVEHMAN